MLETIGPKTRLIHGEKTWIEGEAVRQLTATAGLPGMLLCVGMPDLHPAKGSPNGAAFLADRLYPFLVGTDAGCGVGFWKTSLLVRKLKLNRIATQLQGLDHPWDGDVAQWLSDRGVAATEYDQGLGTPGLGNHFIELQAVAEIVDPSLFGTLNLDKDRLHITVHSGSRRFGETIMTAYAAQHGAEGVVADSEDGQHYLRQHAHAVAWAVANRALCAHRVLTVLGTDGTLILDVCHNSMTAALQDGCPCWLHRKGAAPADQGPVVIPGSRNALSYLVMPVADKPDALQSLAHGAGRKINRGEAFGKLANLYRGKDIRQNQYGGRVVCGQRDLLWEEAPECYKPISTVIGDLVDAGLLTVIATLKPLVTFKTSETVDGEVRRDRKQWQQEREQARHLKRRKA